MKIYRRCACGRGTGAVRQVCGACREARMRETIRALREELAPVHREQREGGQSAS